MNRDRSSPSFVQTSHMVTLDPMLFCEITDHAEAFDMTFLELAKAVEVCLVALLCSQEPHNASDHQIDESRQDLGVAAEIEALTLAFVVRNLPLALQAPRIWDAILSFWVLASPLEYRIDLHAHILGSNDHDHQISPLCALARIQVAPAVAIQATSEAGLSHRFLPY